MVQFSSVTLEKVYYRNFSREVHNSTYLIPIVYTIYLYTHTHKYLFMQHRYLQSTKKIGTLL